MDFSFHKISIQDRKFSKFLSFPNLRPNLRPQDFKASVAEAEAEFSKSSAFGRSLRPSVDLWIKHSQKAAPGLKKTEQYKTGLN